MEYKEFEHFKLLHEYTKFHIGLYGALLGGFVTILKFGQLSSGHLRIMKSATVLMLIAAISGGVTASSMLDIYGNYGIWNVDADSGKTGVVSDNTKTTVAADNNKTDDTTIWQNFLDARIGPLEQRWFRPKVWWMIEHISFWAAVGVFVISFLIMSKLSQQST